MSAETIAAALVFAAVVFATLSCALLWEGLRDWQRRRQVTKRLRPALAEALENGGRGDDLIRSFTDDSLLGSLAAGLPGVRGADDLLREARVDWRPGTLLVLVFGCAAAVGAIALILSNLIIVAIAGTALGAAAPYLYLRRKRKVRLDRFEEEFPEAIDLLTRAIRAGHPLSAGMRMVAEEGPPTVAEEFRQTFEEQRFGLPFADALMGLVDRVNVVDVRIFAVAVLIQREVGGNLAEILDKLATTIRGRFYIRRQLRTYTAQGRMSGYTLAILPILVGVAVFLIEPDHISLLFTTNLGLLLTGGAIVLQLIGALWIRRIVNISI